MPDPRAPELRWTRPVARVLGVPIRLHATLLLVPVTALLFAWSLGESPGPILGLLVAAFGCIVLHELGHALVARRFGVRALDITLYPTGGIARMDRPPAARAEAWIAIAGPLVNVVLAAAVLLGAWIAGGGRGMFAASLPNEPVSFLMALFWINVTVFAFNLVPAYPMDGGRVLRSMLAARLGSERATRLVARFGRVLAAAVIVLAVARLNPWLCLLGIIVLVGADHQARAESPGPTARLRWVREAVQTRFETLGQDDRLAEAARKALESGQHDFPVVDAQGRLLGVLRRATMLEGLAGRGPETSVLDLITRAVPTIGPEESLGAIPARVGARDRLPVLVVEDGRPVGLIPTDRLVESMLLDHVSESDAGDTVADGLRGR